MTRRLNPAPSQKEVYVKHNEGNSLVSDATSTAQKHRPAALTKCVESDLILRRHLWTRGELDQHQNPPNLLVVLPSNIIRNKVLIF